MPSVLDELRKHRAFREVWIGYGIAALLLALYLFNYSDYLPPEYVRQNWFALQQDIYCYGATLTAFLIAVGLPRLVCCERERGADSLIGTTARGRRITWASKVLFTAVYCAGVVLLTGAASLLFHGAQFGFVGAGQPVESCVYFGEDGLPPLSNLTYCIVQYGFLYLGALYFAGFVLLVSALVGRTVFAMLFSGGVYLVFLAFTYVGDGKMGVLDYPLRILYRLGFSGFLLMENYSVVPLTHPLGWPGRWANVWIPVLWVLAMTALEFAGLWLLWRRRAKK